MNNEGNVSSSWIQSAKKTIPIFSLWKLSSSTQAESTAWEKNISINKKTIQFEAFLTKNHRCNHELFWRRNDEIWNKKAIRFENAEEQSWNYSPIGSKSKSVTRSVKQCGFL